ncbi:MAG: serine/threonine-protein kinase, partial [Burkholderiaceae bacterium]
MNGEIALPRGYALHEYRIESTLGVGGFGLTYLATDSNLNLQVAIKEYLPGELAIRRDDHSVRSKSDTTLDTFNWGRTRFLEESCTLASFRHPNIVRVMRFFEANQTAYMVMEFVAGQPLNEWIKSRRPLAEPSIAGIAAGLLDGVELVHRAGYLHRDIKPGNIFIRDDGTPVLLDFGSARVASANTERTAIVSPGYAPLEQYHAHGNQGPWSDLYALGGVLYWIVTGDKPVEASARFPSDPLRPATRAA